MAKEAAGIALSAPVDRAARPVGRDELAHGLRLIQASAIKSVRLQLALERRDRLAAIATVDDLIGLDRRISDFLDQLPASSSPDAAVREQVEAQSRALAREKLVLAAGLSGPQLIQREPWLVPPCRPDIAAPPGEPEPLLLDASMKMPAPSAGGARAWPVGALILIALLLVGATFVALIDGGR